jgi:broad specificity phosphatase PhoE
VSALLLVRHGQASWGSDDYDVLSPLGERQSRVLGEALAARGIEPDLVVRGGMRRHRQTAEHAAAAAGWSTEVRVDPGWDEFDHIQMLSMHPSRYGDGEELTRAQFQAWFEEATLRWTGGEHDGDYGESFTAFGDRVASALRRTVEGLGSAQTAVVFTSGGPVSWVAASLLGGSADLWTRLNPVTVNASVTKVVLGRRGSTLVSFNDHAHLEVGGSELLTYR